MDHEHNNSEMKITTSQLRKENPFPKIKSVFHLHLFNNPIVRSRVNFNPSIKGFNLPAYNIFQSNFVAKLLRYKSGAGMVLCHCWMQKSKYSSGTVTGHTYIYDQVLFQMIKGKHDTTSILTIVISKSDHMAMNATHKRKIESATCSQHTFAKVVE